MLALGSIGSRLFSRNAAMLAAGLLAALAVFPDAAKARINPQQFLLARQCAAQTSDQRAQSVEDPCLKLRNEFSRSEHGEAAGYRIKTALADLLCRLLSSDHVESTQNSGAALLTASQQQLLSTTLPEPLEGPAGDFGPEPALSIVEHLPVARLPDG